MGEGAFNAFRTPGRPTYYEDNRWPVTADTLVYGLLYCFLILAFSFYITIIGIRGIERMYAFTRVTLSLFIGAVILRNILRNCRESFRVSHRPSLLSIIVATHLFPLRELFRIRKKKVCNFGYGWEYGHAEAQMQYKAFTEKQITAEIGIKVGLRGINITLVGNPKKQLNETINYNERFSWEWEQGKPGYGPQAGRINREYKAAKVRGLPYPILWTVEYFTLDGANYRHGRYYRTAGWYCHIVLWTAFPMWLLSNILFFMVIRYGAFFLALTGGCLLLTNILFSSIRNPVPLVLHYQSKSVILQYSWCFWLVLITGILCLILAAIILFMDLRFPEEIATFFDIDVLHDYEDFYADPADLGLATPKVRIERTQPGTSNEDAEERKSQEIQVLRKRTMSSRFQRSTRRLPPLPAPRQVIKAEQSQTTANEQLPVYENININRFDVIGEEEESKAESQEHIILKEMKSIET